MSAYRSGYSTNHVLIRLIENWRHELDNNIFTSEILMDLSKAFDCIPHDLLIANLHAYGLDFDTVTFLHNYLNHRKQSVKINNISSFFRTILSVIPQESILGPILVNIFINDLFLWLIKSDLHNFADDNYIAITYKNMNDLLRALEKESESAVDWFRNNNMIANPDKFQAITMNKRRENQITHKLKIYDNEIETTKSVKLLGTEIDNQLNFYQHISKLCSKATMQLNAICRLAKFMGNKEKIAMINSFVYCSFNHCPLTWYFCSCESSQKIEKIQKRCLRLVLDDYESDYGNLIKKNGTTTVEIKRLRTLATENFKTINNINPSYMKNIFTPKTNAKIRARDIIGRHHNTATYGDKSLTALGQI